MKRIGFAVAVFLALNVYFNNALGCEPFDDSGFNAISLILNLSNEEAVFGNSDFQHVRYIVSLIVAGETPDEKEIQWARTYSENQLKDISTPRLRKKMVKRTMKCADNHILRMANAKLLDMYEGRKLSFKYKNRLESVLEFLAERYVYYLEVLNKRSS